MRTLQSKDAVLIGYITDGFGLEVAPSRDLSKPPQRSFARGQKEFIFGADNLNP